MRIPTLLVPALCAMLILGSACSPDPGDSAEPVSPVSSPTPDEPTDPQKKVWLPKIVPPLDCNPSLRDGQGSANLSPSDTVEIGSINTFEITYTAGKDGIDPKGFVIFQVSPWWGWSAPQHYQRGYPGYTEVIPSFEDPSFKVYSLQLNRILAFSEKRAIEEGETITFRYGPARVDKYAEQEELFQVFVDGDGDGHYACIRNTPTLAIKSLPPARLTVNGPSRACPGDQVTITAFPLDIMGNWAEFAPGEYDFTILDEKGKELKDSLKKVIAEGEERRLSVDYSLVGEGLFFFRVEGPGGMKARSNVLFSQKGRPKLNLYFGDIHGHSRLSDGTGTPEDYYLFAREVSGLDIAALTDHGDYGTIPVKGEVWERIKKAANTANRPGGFITYVAFEWTNWTFGHRNVYFRDGDGPIFRSFDEESDTPQELWKLLDPYEAMTIAHHVGGGPIRTDWSIPPASMERLVEIASIHGSSEYYGGEKSIYSPVQGAFVRDALNKGYRLGIIASGDTHDGHPGKRSAGSFVNGIVGVYAPELTRKAVWDALMRRQVYGTSGPKIILFFRVGESPMGSEIFWDKKKGAIPIAVLAVACDEIEAIEIIRNGTVVFREKGEGVLAQFLIEDTQPLDGTSWYYARIVQKDGNMAWSSPVWVTLEG